jgi:chemotaxis protein methyltransferase CheR
MIEKAEYDFLSALVLQRSGLSLGSGKDYLLEARLIPVAQSWGLSGIDDLVRDLKKGNERMASAVTEAMTTNETLFFRDKTPFEEMIKTLIPPILEARRHTQRLRVWCAAASTGQEPYSFLMMLKDSFPELDRWKIEFIATDISSQALARAQEGIYSQFEVQRGLPIQSLMKHFNQVPDGWQIQESFRKAVSYRKLNLLDHFGHLGKFDVILCRNVLIYFEPDNKQLILERMATMLSDDGFVMLGAAETVMGITNMFERRRECRSATYGLAGKVVHAGR